MTGLWTRLRAWGAVILCSGDYGHDEEMLNYYIPCAKKVQKILYPNSFNTGDGQKMGLWVGAGIDEGPHPPCSLTMPCWTLTGTPEAAWMPFPASPGWQ